MKTILFVSSASGDALEAAKQLGLRVMLLDDAEPGCGGEFVDEQVWFGPYDIDRVREAIDLITPRQPVHAVLTTDERAVPITAVLSEAFGLPGNPYQAAYATRNKYVMRTKLSTSGVPHPRFGVAQSVNQAIRLAREVVGYPLVLKPLFGMVGQGVVRANDPRELEHWFPRVRRIAATHEYFVKGDSYGSYLLLEEYMEGREISVDGVIAGGGIQWIGTFDKPNPLVGPTFEETILLTPSGESPELLDEVFAMVQKGVLAIGLRHGPLHAELRLTPSGPRLLEIAARPIGGICGRAHTSCSGSNYYELIVRNALGEPVEVPREGRNPSGVMMLPVPRSGRLLGVHGVAEAGRVPGVSEVKIVARPGDLIQGFPEQGWYIGFITASGGTPRDVERALNEAHGLLRFDLDSTGGEIDPGGRCGD